MEGQARGDIRRFLEGDGFGIDLLGPLEGTEGADG